MWELLSTRVLFGSLSPLEMFSTAALCWVGLGLVDVLSAFLSLYLQLSEVVMYKPG